MSNLACGFINNNGKIICFDGLYPHAISHALDMANSQLIDQTHHLYHLATFFTEILECGFEEYSPSPSDTIDLAIFFDYPVPRRAKKFNSNIWRNCIICEVENPLFTLSLKRYYTSLRTISPYQADALYSPHTSYLYKYIPKLESSFSPNLDNNKAITSILCRNQSGRSNTLYGFRRHVINAMSLLGKDDFHFYGADWGIPISKYLEQLIACRPTKAYDFSFQVRQFLKIKNFIKDDFRKLYQRYPAVDLSCYRGSAPSKSVLANCRTTLAIENTISVPGYTTEKALEPLIYGCLPLYIATTSNNYLKKYLDILPSDVLHLSASLSSYQNLSNTQLSQDAECIRNSINADLAAGKIRTTIGMLRELIEDL